MIYHSTTTTASQYQLDGNNITGDENVFPFRASWISPTDFVYVSDGKIRRRTLGGSASQTIEFSATFVRGVATHGTGCTYSAAITAGIASGLSLEEAITRAKKFVTEVIAQHFRWTSPSGKNLDALKAF